MTFEKISSEKFKAFEKSEIKNSAAIKGGTDGMYPGETSRPGYSDQLKGKRLTSTANGSGKPNDGFGLD
jgi:hypothetical protein